MDAGLQWEGIAALVALFSALYGLYKIGIDRGKQEMKVSELEKDIKALEQKVDKSLSEFSERLTRMEDRIYRLVTDVSESIKKEIRRVGNRPNAQDDRT